MRPLICAVVLFLAISCDSRSSLGEQFPPAESLRVCRSQDQRANLLSRNGGTAETELAVQRALEWLVRQQRSDGSWSLTGPYRDGGRVENALAATSMALLALQGAGNTTDDGPYSEAVRKAAQKLVLSQGDDGRFDLGKMLEQQAMYAQAQAAIAICELFAMTGDAALEVPARRAVAFAERAQMPDGGWKYRLPNGTANDVGDMSVTGWFVTAIKSGEIAGIQPSPQVYAGARGFLDRVFVSKEQGYGYQIASHNRGFKLRPALTAEGLLCRQYLGIPRNAPELTSGVALLLDNVTIDFGSNESPAWEKDLYAWYYITQVCHHLGGRPWQRWNAQLRSRVPAAQISTGPEKGSWDPAYDQWGDVGGRLYATCLCTCMLETYYRYPKVDADDEPAEEPLIPNEADIIAARALVRDAFEADFARAAGNDSETLIEKLIAASAQTERPARTYALLLEAEQVAATAGRFGKTLDIVDRRARQFDVNPTKEREAWLQEFLNDQSRREPDVLASVFELAMQTARRGLKEESLESATSAAGIAAAAAEAIESVGRAARDDELSSDGELKQREADGLAWDISVRQAILTKYEAALAKLKNSPRDPAANELVGVYRCFCRGDWTAGLPALQRSGNGELAQVAALEESVMAEVIPNRKQMFDLAGKWWNISREREEPAIRRHCAVLYSLCCGGLSDPLDKALAEKRMMVAATPEAQASDPGDASSALNHRLRWKPVSEGWQFMRTADDGWIDVSVEKEGYRWELLRETDDCIEIYEWSTNTSVRLYADRADQAAGDDPRQWELLHRGGWQ